MELQMVNFCGCGAPFRLIFFVRWYRVYTTKSFIFWQEDFWRRYQRGNPNP